jgi:hypothetical protein
VLGVEVGEVEERVIGIGVCVVVWALEEQGVRGGMEGGEVTARDKELAGPCGDEVDGAGVPARWTVPGSREEVDGAGFLGVDAVDTEDPAASSVSTRLMATESDDVALHK